MKRWCICAIIVLAGIQVYGQVKPQNRQFKDTRPKQFQGISQINTKQLRGAVDAVPILSKTFDVAKNGDRVDIPIANGQILRGIVVMRKTRSENASVMRLRITNYEDAEMYIVKRISQGIPRYYATVHHPKYSDALVLDGRVFEYKSQNNLIVE